MQQTYRQLPGACAWGLLCEGAIPSISLKPNYIYGLCAPDVQEVVYIGRTVDPAKRLGRHISNVRPEYAFVDNTPKDEWIRGLLVRGLRPRMTILEEIAPCAPLAEVLRSYAVDQVARYTLMSEEEALFSVYVHQREGRWQLRALQLGWPLLGHPPHVQMHLLALGVNLLTEPMESPVWSAVRDILTRVPGGRLVSAE